MELGNLYKNAVGIGAVLLSLSDAHKVGIAGRNKAPQSYIAKTYLDAYVNSKQINANIMPTVVSNLKRRWFNFRMDDSFIPAIQTVKGYCSGFTNQFVNNIIPFSLGLGALAFKKGGGKLCAALLTLGAIKMALYDVCSFGQHKKI